MRVTDLRVAGIPTERMPPYLPHLTLVEVEADNGLIGIGATWYAHHKVLPLLTQGADALNRLIVGRNPEDVSEIWDELYRMRWMDGPLAIGALGAVDMALWDLRGKAAEMPLHAMLGGARHNRIMAYASSSAFVSGSYEGSGPWKAKSAAELARETEKYIHQGFHAIKFGWGNHFRPEDEERLAAIRCAAGPSVRLMVDFGCPAYWSAGWNAAAAIRAARLLERYQVFFFEEPLPPFDVRGHAEVQAECRLHISTGESLACFHDFERYMERRAVDIIQPDAMQMGVTQLQRIARRAQEAGMMCVPHSPWSVFAATCHLQVLSTVDNGPMIEYPAFASFEDGSPLAKATWLSHYELVERPPKLVEGFLELPDGPGLGLGLLVPECIQQLQEVAEFGYEL